MQVFVRALPKVSCQQLQGREPVRQHIPHLTQYLRSQRPPQTNRNGSEAFGDLSRIRGDGSQALGDASR